MKYKVGDRVKVREDLVVEDTYGGFTFNEFMDNMKGLFVTIEAVRKKTYYLIEENNFCWTDEMFEDLVDTGNTEENNLVGSKMNLRLEIASRLLAGNLQGWEQTYEVGELLCKYYLSMADTLIKLEEETR